MTCRSASVGPRDPDPELGGSPFDSDELDSDELDSDVEPWEYEDDLESDVDESGFDELLSDPLRVEL